MADYQWLLWSLLLLSSWMCFTGETSIRVKDPIRSEPLEFEFGSIESILPNID